MAEDFHGVKPVSADLKPDQQTLRDRQDDWGTSDTSDALDKLLAAQDSTATPEPPKTTEPPKTPEPPKTDDTPDPAAVKAAAADDINLDDLKVKVDDPTKPAATPPATPDPADPYPDLQLSAKVSGKTAEQWAALKSRYATDSKAKDDEIASLKAKVTEYEAKTSDPIPEETKKELEDLRQFRARLDVEADPAFQAQFDQRLATAQNFIYAQLASAGWKKDTIDKVKEIGVENVDWESLEKEGKVPASMMRLVQSRLDEMAVIKYDRQAKLDEAKTNIADYIKKQREEYAAKAQGHTKATDDELAKFLPKLAFLSEPEKPKASASKDELTIYEAEVKHRQEILDSIAEAKRDDSPYMRALLIAGMAQLLNLKPRFENIVAAYKQLEEKHTKAIAWIEKVKSAGKPKAKDASAEPTPPKPGVDYTKTAGEALDALWKQANQ